METIVKKHTGHVLKYTVVQQSGGGIFFSSLCCYFQY